MAVTTTNPLNAVWTDFRNHHSHTKASTGQALQESLRSHYPNHTLTTITSTGGKLVEFAAAGFLSLNLNTSNDCNIVSKSFKPPLRSQASDKGTFKNEVKFGQYDAEFKGENFVVYLAQYMDERYRASNYYLLHKTTNLTPTGGSVLMDELIEAAARWQMQANKSILEFDSGSWSNNSKLWADIQKCSWDTVIIDDAKKAALRNDVEGFFDREAIYRKFSASWKRGVLLHGTPGNGKTMTIKAIMKTLGARDDPIPSLYVKSIIDSQGSDFTTNTIKAVFSRAREMAPCVLIMEDIDSMITEKTRTYLLNEIDGMESNDGILMIGSTNNLDTLDPGLSKRPSRFDRKFFFATPTLSERFAYCMHWRSKLESMKTLVLSESLCEETAKITDGFSYAYLKELFVSTLWGVANGEGGEAEWESVPDDTEGGLNASMLGRALAAQVELLRNEMGAGDE
ncbi:MAG: hypothetical protein M1814_003739 [Vezdaea aestivalis]|nr:MAG: hypothetical protein M1814_003739 [Vezdaea aestivalis]